MKKAALIIISVLLLSCLFATVAFAAPAEAQLLRAGGSGGGGGGFGGFGGGRFFGRNSIFDFLADSENMEGGELAFGLLAYIALYALAATHIIAAILIPIIVRRRKKKARKETRRLMAEYDDFDGFWSYDFVQNRIKEVYFAVQNAWAAGDMKNAEDMVTEALFKKYQKHLDAQKRDGEKNVMEDIVLSSAVPVYAKDFTSNEHDYLWIRIEGSMVDYVILEETGYILQGTKANLPFCEYWRLTRRRDGNWVLAEIMQEYDFEKTKYYKGLDKL